LYAALARLERDGLIEALPEDDRRRPYRITAAGTQVLAVRLADTAKIAQLGLARLRTANS
jgi:DNA-binding PadR family transcriptional regulator